MIGAYHGLEVLPKRWRDDLVMLLMPEINPDGLDIVDRIVVEGRGRCT